MDFLKSHWVIIVLLGLILAFTPICKADCGPVIRHPEEKELTLQIFEALVEDGYLIDTPERIEAVLSVSHDVALSIMYPFLCSSKRAVKA